MVCRLHRRALLAAPLSLLLAACTTNRGTAPGSVAPAVPTPSPAPTSMPLAPSQTPFPAAAPASAAAIPATVANQQPEISVSPIMMPGLTLPPARPNLFWIPDEPKELSPLAFGTLPREYQPESHLTIHGYDLAVSLPQMPMEADVYVVGTYPADFTDRFNSIVVRDGEGWEWLPPYSLLQCQTTIPRDEKQSIATDAQAAERAARLLTARGLLMPDSVPPVIHDLPDGTWRLSFHRHINGVIVYTNKGLAVSLNRDGQATNIIGRRRPLLAKSRYPLRTPDEAWRMLAAGRGRPFYVDDGAPAFYVGKDVIMDRFVVRQIELAYAETEVYAAPGSQGRRPAEQQVMQPYYIFHNEQDYTLYVPAVTDSYVT
ncbi:MAG: hypothetical protein ACR2JW_09245 [Thermomicrobiales bacterium]